MNSARPPDAERQGASPSRPEATSVPDAARSPHLMVIAGAIGIWIGIVGFLVGIAQPVVPQRVARRERPRSDQAVALAPSYRQLAERTRGPNGSWHAHLETLLPAPPGLFAPVVRTPALKDAALRDRLRTRAFDGAPPVVPHSIDQHSDASCLACHAAGLRLGERIASRVSHPHFSNCTQCHVAASGGPPTQAVLSENPAPPANAFSGILRSGPGRRAMPHAPPTIPHPLLLRNDCLSCHGLIARPGLRTTHPWLQNCTQCHVAEAELDALPFQPVEGKAEPASAAVLGRQFKHAIAAPPEASR